LVGVLVVGAFIGGTLAWMVLRRINGLPALARFNLQRGQTAPPRPYEHDHRTGDHESRRRPATTTG
jgi:hypothetical protein